MKNVDRRAQREAVLLGDRAAERVEPRGERERRRGLLEAVEEHHFSEALLL